MFYIFQICPFHLSKIKILSPLNSCCSSRVTTARCLKCLKPTIAEAQLWLKAQRKFSLTHYPENAPLETWMTVKHCKSQRELTENIKWRVFSHITSRALLQEISRGIFSLTYPKMLKSSQALHNRAPFLAAPCLPVSNVLHTILSGHQP